MTFHPDDVAAVMSSNRNKLLGTIADVQAAIRKANGKELPDAENHSRR